MKWKNKKAKKDGEIDTTPIISSSNHNHNQIGSKGNKDLLYRPDIQVLYMNRSAYTKSERRFKQRYTVYPQLHESMQLPDEDFSSIFEKNGEPVNDGLNVEKYSLVCDAMVLDNNITVLILPNPIQKIIEFFSKDILNLKVALSFDYQDNTDTTNIIGKYKRGAKHVNGSDVIAIVKLTFINMEGHLIRSVLINLCSPIAGKILEINDTLEAAIIQSKSCENNDQASFQTTAILDLFSEGKYSTNGYILVMASEAPRIIDQMNDRPVGTGEGKLDDNVCFAWVKGKCGRGDKCKFIHSMLPTFDQSPSGQNNVVHDAVVS
jgi:hypothetical protein